MGIFDVFKKKPEVVTPPPLEPAKVKKPKTPKPQCE